MGKKRWIIPLVLAAMLTAALAAPVLSVVELPSQANAVYDGTPTPEPTPTPTPTPVPTTQGESSNDVGVGKDVYAVDEIVYAAGSGFPANSNVNVYIWYDITWVNGMTIPGDVSGDGVNNVPTDGAGNLGPANVWSPPLTPGDYDMVFDADKNGNYDPPGDFVDGPNPPGFRVMGPVGGIVEPVDTLELAAVSTGTSDGGSMVVSIALGTGIAVLFAGFLVWSLRRRRVISTSARQ